MPGCIPPLLGSELTTGPATQDIDFTTHNRGDFRIRHFPVPQTLKTTHKHGT